jgi:hypothetical protein
MPVDDDELTRLEDLIKVFQKVVKLRKKYPELHLYIDEKKMVAQLAAYMKQLEEMQRKLDE